MNGLVKDERTREQMKPVELNSDPNSATAPVPATPAAVDIANISSRRSSNDPGGGSGGAAGGPPPPSSSFSPDIPKEELKRLLLQQLEYYFSP